MEETRLPLFLMGQVVIYDFCFKLSFIGDPLPLFPSQNWTIFGIWNWKFPVEINQVIFTPNIINQKLTPCHIHINNDLSNFHLTNFPKPNRQKFFLFLTFFASQAVDIFPNLHHQPFLVERKKKIFICQKEKYGKNFTQKKIKFFLFSA